MLQSPGHRHRPGVSGWSLAGLRHAPRPAVQGRVRSLPPPPGNISKHQRRNIGISPNSFTFSTTYLTRSCVVLIQRHPLITPEVTSSFLYWRLSVCSPEYRVLRDAVSRQRQCELRGGTFRAVLVQRHQVWRQRHGAACRWDRVHHAQYVSHVSGFLFYTCSLVGFDHQSLHRWFCLVSSGGM